MRPAVCPFGISITPTQPHCSPPAPAARLPPPLQLRSAAPARPTTLPPGAALQAATSWAFNAAAGSPYVPVAELPAVAAINQYDVADAVRGSGQGGLSITITANGGGFQRGGGGTIRRQGGRRLLGSCRVFMTVLQVPGSCLVRAWLSNPRDCAMPFPRHPLPAPSARPCSCPPGQEPCAHRGPRHHPGGWHARVGARLGQGQRRVQHVCAVAAGEWGGGGVGGLRQYIHVRALQQQGSNSGAGLDAKPQLSFLHGPLPDHTAHPS
jgi:hypothetical protein